MLRWKAEYEKIVEQNITHEKNGMNTFTLGTTDAITARSSLRTCACRGFIGEEPGHISAMNPNSSTDTSTLLFCTTDKLMNKARDIRKDNRIEAVFWFAKTAQQIRIRGEAFLVDQYGNGVPTHITEKHIQSGLDFDWKMEWERIWQNQSPTMRGSFRSARPGSPLDSEEKTNKVQVHPIYNPSDTSNADVNEARDRFVIVVIAPEECEILDLVPPPGKRMLYKQDSAIELCP